MGRDIAQSHRESCCCCSHDVPGVLFPMTIYGPTGTKESEDGRILVERCDECALFRDDEDAAHFLSVISGAPIRRWYDSDTSPYWHWCVDMSLERANNFRIPRKEELMEDIEVCYLCEQELNMVEPDWCQIRQDKGGPIKVHDKCAAPILFMYAESRTVLGKLREHGAQSVCPADPIIDQLNQKPGFASSDLDGMVHEAASHEATVVNNRGMKEQVLYLLRHGFDPEVILEGED